MKITGAKAWVFLDSFDKDKVITGLDTEHTKAGQWYRILEKGEGSKLPLEVGFPFRAPALEEDEIQLTQGDRIYPLDPERFCKTSANLQAEQGSVDVGDDCDPGATILDGIVKATGSLAGLFRYDDETYDFDDVTDTVINRFFNIVKDDGAGLYELEPRNDDPIFMLCCLNSNAKVGQTENWLYIPISISSMSMSLGNTDAQNKDLSWSKGEGEAGIYKRLKAA